MDEKLEMVCRKLHRMSKQPMISQDVCLMESFC